MGVCSTLKGTNSLEIGSKDVSITTFRNSIPLFTMVGVVHIIPIGATLGAISWFWVMKKNHLLEEINKGNTVPHGSVWYSVGKYLYVVCATILCLVALVMKVAF